MSRDFKVYYDVGSGNLNSLRFGASTDGVKDANAASVWVPRYKSANPQDGVEWDQIALDPNTNKRDTYEKSFRITDRYFDMKAINDYGVFFGAWRPDGSLQYLQDYGANLKPKYIGLS